MAGPTLVGQRLTADFLNAGIYRPYCKMKQTVAQAITNNSPAALTFTTEDHDPEGWHDNVTNTSRVTPNIAGDYRITVQPVMAGTATITAAYCAVYLNGSVFSRGGNTKPGTSAVSFQLAPHIEVVTLNGTTDYIEGYINVSTSTTENTNVSATGQSRLLVEYLGSYN